MGVNVSPIRIHRVEYRDIGRERLDSDKKLRCHRMMTPETIDIVVNNGVLITMDKRRRILLDGALAIHNGRIVAIGNSTDVSRTYRPDRTIDANGGVVHPGFIDCHVHLSLHLGRGSIPDSWPVEREHEQWLPYWTGLTEHEAYCAATLGCMEMVRNGTTTCCDQSGRYPVQLTAEAVANIGMKAILTESCWDCHPVPEVAMGDVFECVKRLEQSLKSLPRSGDKSIWAAVGLAGMGMCSDQLIAAGKRLADEHKSILTMHQSFGPNDVALYQRLTGGKTAAAHLAQLEVLADNVQLIHMIHAEESELEILARERVNVIHCPSASTRAGMGVSHVGRFPQMLEQGVNVALGSDAGTYSDFLDVGRQAYLAATLHREAKQQVPTISAHQALEMATLNGARSLGIIDETGSLEVGKRADVVIQSASRPEWHPLTNVVNNLIYGAQSVGVETVLVDGETVLEGGQFTRVDEQKQYASIDAAALDLHRRIDFKPPPAWPVSEGNPT